MCNEQSAFMSPLSYACRAGKVQEHAVSVAPLKTTTAARSLQADHVMGEGASGFLRWMARHAREMWRDIGYVLRIPTFNIVVLQARPTRRSSQDVQEWVTRSR